MGQQVAFGQPQQGSNPHAIAKRHAFDRPGIGAAHGVEHVRLCLVVGMVPGGHRHGIVLGAKRFKPRRAGFARFALEALGPFDEGLGFEHQDLQWAAVFCGPIGHGLAVAVVLLTSGAVVDMGDDQLVSQRMQHLEQHCGVEAATGRHNELGRTVNPGFLQRATYMFLHLVHGTRH